MIIYHNARCRKSRETLELIKKEGVEAEVVEYLKNPLKESEIRTILKKLKMKAADIIRKNEPLYLEKYASKKLSEKEWIRVLSDNPVLMERPIVVKDNKAVLGRPPENVKKLF